MSESQKLVVAGIDAGGTTYKCALASTDGNILVSKRIPVTTPDETLQLVCDYLLSESASLGASIQSVGVASFGPVDIDPASPRYGHILSTPKPHWSNAPIRSFLVERLGVEVVVETDVNGALAAEMKWGAAVNCHSAAYYTVGTGIGAGFYANGGFIGKPSHPEFGHIQVKRHADDLNFNGVCAFHGDCLEGLASATAIRARFGEPKDLADDHIMWDIEAFYLAQACLATAMSIRPEVIILGGGVMLRPILIEKVRTQFDRLMNGYLDVGDSANLIKTPGLGDDAGLKGGVLLALESLKAN